MADENDTPLTDEELARAREGEALIAAAVADVRAPQSLRESIERERDRAGARRPPPFWRRHRIGLAAAGAAAAALVVVAVVLGTGGASSEPTLASVVAAARLEPTDPAPSTVGGTPPDLDARVDNVVFPDWEESFGWRADGLRGDSLDGRPVTTVSYRNPDGAALGYAVVSGDALDEQPAGRRVTRDGKDYYVASEDGRTVVTWEQQGQTCVIVASAEVPSDRLVELAASRNV